MMTFSQQTATYLPTLNPINSLVHETLNAEYELTFTLAGIVDIKKYDLVSADTPNGRQKFRVASVEYSATETVVFARHIFFDLSGNFSLGFNSKDVTCQTAIGLFINSLIEPLSPFTVMAKDITKRGSYNPEEANALEVLTHGKRSLVGIFEADLYRDNHTVELRGRLGRDTNVLIHPRKNIIDLSREYSSDDVCTKIILRGGSEENPLSATVTSPLVNEYPNVYIRRYQNETDQITTTEQLIAWGKLFFETDRIDVPSLSFDFDVVNTVDLNLGDSCLVRVPQLGIDVRERVNGYDYDPMSKRLVKLYFGNPELGMSSIVGDIAEGVVEPFVKDLDDKLQAEIDNANNAIDKEIEERKTAVNDAIAKAEAEAEVMKKEIQDEISQAVTDWNTEFEEAKTQIDNSIGNVEKILGEEIEANASEIKQTADKISLVVADGSSASGITIQPNALTAIAKDINLKGNVQFDSLVEGDGTNTQILGGKIKTNSISANKLIVGNSQSLVNLVKGETPPDSNIEWTNFTSNYWHAVFSDVGGGWSNCQIFSLSVKQLGWVGRNVRLRVQWHMFGGASIACDPIFEFYDKDMNAIRGVVCERQYIGQVDFVAELGDIHAEYEHVIFRLRGTSVGLNSLYRFFVSEMNAGELIVDGAIRANHIVSGSAELGAVTSKVLSTEALNASWANIGNAFINKLTSDDALFQRLTAKSAWITSANIVSLEASRIKGGTLQSTNGTLTWDLNNSYLKFNGVSNAMERVANYGNGNYSVGVNFGELYSKLLGRTCATVSLYANKNDSNDASNCRIDLISDEQTINIRGDWIEFYDHDASTYGARMKTHGGAFLMYPWGAGTGGIGATDKPWLNLIAKNIVDVASNYSMTTTFSTTTPPTGSDVLRIVESCPVTTLYSVPDTDTLDLAKDTPETATLAIDFTPLRRERSDDTTLLFTEQGEMTLNTEIAILWKAVQELSEQNKTLQEQITLLETMLN